MAYRARRDDSSALVIQNLSGESLKVPVTWPEARFSPWDTGQGLPEIHDNALALPPFSGCVWY